MRLWMFLACAPPAEPVDPDCARLCDELVGVCALETFPDRSSCLDGCAYGLATGADPRGWHDCARRADCDPFALVACEHDHGAE